MQVLRRAVLADPHPLWLDAVAHVLESVDVEVVARATSPERALECVQRDAPDLIVTEIEFPASTLDGIESLRRIGEVAPSTKAIVLAASHETDHIDAALRAGARAYVVKTAHPADVASAVRQAFDHSVFLAPAHAGSPAVPALGEGNGSQLVDSPGVPPLTRREAEILQLVSDGLSNSQIAARLWVAEQTVKFHLSNVYKKLNACNRTEASRIADRAGLLSQGR